MGHVDAVRHRRRREHSHRAIRHVERRPHEDRVSQRAGRALRTNDAGHLRRALQLLVPRANVGSVGGNRAIARARPAVHLGSLFPSATQLPAPRLDRAVPVRCLAGGMQFLPARPQRDAAAPLERHVVRTVRHFAAHERPGLPEPQPGRAFRVGQQPGRIRSRPVARHQHAARTVREDRREGRR